jgi:hypothetical protein
MVLFGPYERGILETPLIGRNDTMFCPFCRSRLYTHISLKTTRHYIRSMKLRNVATIKSICI